MAGQPTKLNAELQKTFCECLKLALSIESACDYVNISRITYYNWINRGDAEAKGIYTDFFNAVKKAQIEAEVKLIQDLHKDQSWQSKAWILQRRFRDKWGDKAENTEDASRPINIEFKVNEKEE